MTSFKTTISRNLILKTLGASIIGAKCSSLIASKSSYFPIGATDWSIGGKQHIKAFEIAKEIGLECLQVSFSTPGSEYDLRDKRYVNCITKDPRKRVFVLLHWEWVF